MLSDVRRAVKVVAQAPGEDFSTFEMGIISFKNQKYFRLTSQRDKKEIDEILRKVNEWLQQFCTLEPTEEVRRFEQDMLYKWRRKKKAEIQ